MKLRNVTFHDCFGRGGSPPHTRIGGFKARLPWAIAQALGPPSHILVRYFLSELGKKEMILKTRYQLLKLHPLELTSPYLPWLFCNMMLVLDSLHFATSSFFFILVFFVVFSFLFGNQWCLFSDSARASIVDQL